MTNFKFRLSFKSIALASLLTTFVLSQATAAEMGNAQLCWKATSLEATNYLLLAESLKRDDPTEAIHLYNKAIALFLQAIEIMNSKAIQVPSGILRNIALSYLKLTDWSNAIKYYNLAIEREEKARDHHNIAMAYIEKAKKSHADNPSMAKNLVLEFYRLAASHFDKYINLVPNASAPCFIDAAICHFNIGNRELANRYRDVAIKKDPDILIKAEAVKLLEPYQFKK
jgi:tetratricopeptide (TPR) repeat protein